MEPLQPDTTAGNFSPNSTLFRVFAVVLIASIWGGLLSEQYWLPGIPFFLLLFYLTIVDFRKVFYLLLFCLPLSVEFFLPGGFATDLPTEPMMLGLMGVFILYVSRHYREMSGQFLKHPITLLLLLHLAWIFFTAMFSQNVMVSVKFFLAKVWYIAVFYFLTGFLLKKKEHLQSFFWWIYIPLTLLIIQTIIRHASYGFTFSDIGWCVTPFFRNHVNYASMLTLFFPFLMLAMSWQKRGSSTWIMLLFSLVLYVVAIQLSFTRAAYVGLVAAFGVYFVIRLKLMKWSLAGGMIVAVIWIGSILKENKYLDYAPDFEKTITFKNFDNLLEATYKGEDISTMERVYRWVAGYGMNQAKPWLGFGPGNFYGFYRGYTVTSFRTYVSDNPEQSGIHNYFLMTLVEQGFPGLIIFIGLIVLVLIRGEQIYHRLTDPDYRRITMAAIMSIVVIDCLLLINDMVETDKVGTFFFMNMALIVNMEIRSRREV
jgi:O-antigen ligase